jgi:minor extracellular serine protease Vpr
MKRFTGMLIAGLLVCLSANGQSKWSVSAKFFLADIEKYVQGGEWVVAPDAYVKDMYALQLRDQVWWVGAAVLIEPGVFQPERLRAIGAIQQSDFGHILTIQVPASEAYRLDEVPGIRHIDIGSGEDLTLDRSLADVYADSVRAGLGALNRAYKGKDVVIGVIDWGFDFTHPNFYSEDLSTFRVARVWDQNQTAGTPPTGFNFGTEYATEAAIIAAEHDDPYTFGIGSHGTHTAGIAGGGGAGTDNIGVASEADLIFIPYRRDAASLLDGMTYVKNYANSVNKPFVFNMSTGSHLGPHDGSSLKNQAISSIVGEGAVFVGSAGNNGVQPFHLQHVFNGTDTISSVATIANVADQWGMALPIWGAANEDIYAAFSLITQQGDTVWTSPWFESALEPGIDTTFTINGHSFSYRVQAIASDPSNDKANIRLEVARGTPYRLALHLSATNGRVDVWNVVRLQTRYTNWGYAFSASTGSATWPGYINGDVLYAVGEPSGVGPDVITVGAYQAAFTTFTGFPLGGDLANFTSSGPTVDGRVKPDITAPGMGVKSSISSFDPNPASATNNVTFNGKNYAFAALSGTSMSGPTVAGIVALMLEANPRLTAQAAKTIIINTARQDDKTGTLPPGGHLRWGHGKINAFDAIIEVLASVSVKNFSTNTSNIKVYPNPASGMANIQVYDLPQGQYHAVLTDVMGRPVFEMAFSGGQQQSRATMDLRHLPSGTYQLRISGQHDATIHMARVVLNTR